MGIALDSTYARAQGLIDGGELEEILGGLAACGLPAYSTLLEERKDGELLVLEGLRHFREHLGGRLAITLPRGIGGRIDVHEMDHRAIAGAIEFLRGR